MKNAVLRARTWRISLARFIAPILSLVYRPVSKAWELLQEQHNLAEKGFLDLFQIPTPDSIAPIIGMALDHDHPDTTNDQAHLSDVVFLTPKTTEQVLAILTDIGRILISTPSDEDDELAIIGSDSPLANSISDVLLINTETANLVKFGLSHPGPWTGSDVGLLFSGLRAAMPGTFSNERSFSGNFRPFRVPSGVLHLVRDIPQRVKAKLGCKHLEQESVAAPGGETPPAALQQQEPAPVKTEEELATEKAAALAAEIKQNEAEYRTLRRRLLPISMARGVAQFQNSLLRGQQWSHWLTEKRASAVGYTAKEQTDEQGEQDALKNPGEEVVENVLDSVYGDSVVTSSGSFGSASEVAVFEHPATVAAVALRSWEQSNTSTGDDEEAFLESYLHSKFQGLERAILEQIDSRTKPKNSNAFEADFLIPLNVVSAFNVEENRGPRWTALAVQFKAERKFEDTSREKIEDILINGAKDWIGVVGGIDSQVSDSEELVLINSADDVSRRPQSSVSQLQTTANPLHTALSATMLRGAWASQSLSLEQGKPQMIVADAVNGATFFTRENYPIQPKEIGVFAALPLPVGKSSSSLDEDFSSAKQQQEMLFARLSQQTLEEVLKSIPVPESLNAFGHQLLASPALQQLFLGPIRRFLTLTNSDGENGVLNLQQIFRHLTTNFSGTTSTLEDPIDYDESLFPGYNSVEQLAKFGIGRSWSWSAKSSDWINSKKLFTLYKQQRYVIAEKLLRDLALAKANFLLASLELFRLRFGVVSVGWEENSPSFEPSTIKFLENLEEKIENRGKVANTPISLEKQDDLSSVISTEIFALDAEDEMLDAEDEMDELVLPVGEEVLPSESEDEDEIHDDPFPEEEVEEEDTTSAAPPKFFLHHRPASPGLDFAHWFRTGILLAAQQERFEQWRLRDAKRKLKLERASGSATRFLQAFEAKALEREFGVSGRVVAKLPPTVKTVLLEGRSSALFSPEELEKLGELPGILALARSQLLRGLDSAKKASTIDEDAAQIETLFSGVQSLLGESVLLPLLTNRGDRGLIKSGAGALPLCQLCTWQLFNGQVVRGLLEDFSKEIHLAGAAVLEATNIFEVFAKTPEEIIGNDAWTALPTVLLRVSPKAIPRGKTAFGTFTKTSPASYGLCVFDLSLRRWVFFSGLDARLGICEQLSTMETSSEGDTTQNVKVEVVAVTHQRISQTHPLLVARHNIHMDVDENAITQHLPTLSISVGAFYKDSSNESLLTAAYRDAVERALRDILQPRIYARGWNLDYSASSEGVFEKSPGSFAPWSAARGVLFPSAEYRGLSDARLVQYAFSFSPDGRFGRTVGSITNLVAWKKNVLNLVSKIPTSVEDEEELQDGTLCRSTHRKSGGRGADEDTNNHGVPGVIADQMNSGQMNKQTARSDFEKPKIDTAEEAKWFVLEEEEGQQAVAVDGVAAQAVGGHQGQSERKRADKNICPLVSDQLQISYNSDRSDSQIRHRSDTDQIQIRYRSDTDQIRGILLCFRSLCTEPLCKDECVPTYPFYPRSRLRWDGW